ncbi:MAG: AAA family ATPase [Candidatus Lokiarchaeota archaeon]|nr:AAA family ATPase [Candidatus Lokiarchaeota archaeon]
MCGLPASGKSTLAARIGSMLQETNQAPPVRVLDIDALREAMYGGDSGAAFSPEREGEVRAAKLREIDDALGAGHTVIDDDMNYFRSMRKEVADVACKHRVHYAIVHVATPLKQCIAWNARRQRPVPANVIEDVASKLDPPGSRSYSWDEPILTVNLARHGIDDAVVKLREGIERAKLHLHGKQRIEALLGGSTSVTGNPAFWNLALTGRIVNDGFLVSDVREWRDAVQRAPSGVLDMFEVATRRAIGARASMGEALPPPVLKEAKRFKRDAMKVLKKDPSRLDALIAGFNEVLGTKSD